MKITYYGYNTFLIQNGKKNVVIDPGGDLFLFRLKSLLPESSWRSITYIFVTHADPDHYWHSDRVQKASNAKVICNNSMLKMIKGERYMISPRKGGLSFRTLPHNIHPIEVNGMITLDDLRITGIKAVHGPLRFKFGPFKKTIKPGKEERIGLGAIGFKIELDCYTLVNLGDTLLLEDEWKSLGEVDVLMIPIGGGRYGNTMDEAEALKAIKIVKPKYVIPCHYNCSSFLAKNRSLLDISEFTNQVEKFETKCIALKQSESFEI